MTNKIKPIKQKALYLKGFLLRMLIIYDSQIFILDLVTYSAYAFENIHQRQWFSHFESIPMF